MRSAGRALTGLVGGVGGIGLRRCAPCLYPFLCFLLSFRLDSSGCEFMPLASSCSIANGWPARSNARDMPHLLRGLACSRVPGHFLACIPVFSGFVVSRPLDASFAVRHAGEIVKIGLTRPLPVRFVSCSFWNARVTCFCETRASPVFVFSLCPSLE